MKKSLIQVAVLAVVAIVVLILILLWAFKPEIKLPTPVVIDTSDQPRTGNPDAKIHIVVFEDLKCIACKQFNNNLLPKIEKEYVDTGLANYTIINLAFIPGSLPAANAARCIYTQNPTQFFKFVNTVYQNQPPENQDWATIPKLMEFANNLTGIDNQKLSQCIYESPYTKFIQNNFELARRLQGEVVYTPTLYVNGYLVDPLTWDHFNKVIKAAK
jgi:protein-disulfide isomerase